MTPPHLHDPRFVPSPTVIRDPADGGEHAGVLAGAGQQVVVRANAHVLPEDEHRDLVRGADFFLELRLTAEL